MIARLRFWMAWLRWEIQGPYRYGDPSLGTGWIRAQNRKILNDDWKKREPKIEDYQ